MSGSRSCSKHKSQDALTRNWLLSPPRRFVRLPQLRAYSRTGRSRGRRRSAEPPFAELRRTAVLPKACFSPLFPRRVRMGEQAIVRSWTTKISRLDSAHNIFVPCFGPNIPTALWLKSSSTTFEKVPYSQTISGQRLRRPDDFPKA